MTLTSIAIKHAKTPSKLKTKIKVQSRLKARRLTRKLFTTEINIKTVSLLKLRAKLSLTLRLICITGVVATSSLCSVAQAQYAPAQSDPSSPPTKAESDFGAQHSSASPHKKQNHHPSVLLHKLDSSKGSINLNPKSKSKVTRLAAFGETEAVVSLGEKIAIEQGLPKDWVIKKISGAHLIPSAVQQMMPAPAPVLKNWHAYRARFIEPKRINQGVLFWQRNAATLAQAERDFGVAPEIIIGILGVETLYGQHMGAYPVLDSLATLSLEFPREHPRALERQTFFQNELGFFLKAEFTRPLSEKNEVLGSYAGATGAAQFMPSSLAKFAVDYDHDGQIDLIHSTKDAIGSIANYFKMFGWQNGVPTRFAVDVSAPQIDLEGLLIPDILPTFSAQSFEAKGAKLSAEGKSYSGLLALIELQNGTEPKEYLAGTENFYVVTRYNWSSYYAMAVLDLGQAVREAYETKVATTVH